MSLSGAHKAAFRREAPREGRVFTIRDKRGVPLLQDAGGNRALPFWSKSSRARRVVGQVAAYSDFEVVEIDMDDWLDRWLPGCERDGLLVGINWAGPRATGYDMAAAEIGGWLADRS
jgi:hypothetical protein